MTSDPAFSGFGRGTFDFLRALAANNDKAWFDAHRADYTACYLQPALAFVSDLGPRLAAGVSPRINYEARVNGSLFRINRDVRFSADKTPYKTHLDLWFWEGEKRGWETPGFFFRLLPESLLLGAGMHHFSPASLTAYRQAVVKDRTGDELSRTVAAVEASGPYAVGPESRKSVPRGFSADHPRARFLLYEGLHATLETALPAEVETAAFVDYCVEHFGAMAPINDWLRGVIV